MIYCTMFICVLKTTNELWESLDREYKIEDFKVKKFVIDRFFEFMMVDSKTVISQVQEIQINLYEIHTEGMILSETFQVAAIIEKLPHEWKDCNNYRKHKQMEMNLEEFIVRFRIEEDSRGSEKKMFNPSVVKANVVENGQNFKNKPRD